MYVGLINNVMYVFFIIRILVIVNICIDGKLLFMLGYCLVIYVLLRLNKYLLVMI